MAGKKRAYDTADNDSDGDYKIGKRCVVRHQSAAAQRDAHILEAAAYEAALSRFDTLSMDNTLTMLIVAAHQAGIATEFDDASWTGHRTENSARSISVYNFCNALRREITSSAAGFAEKTACLLRFYNILSHVHAESMAMHSERLFRITAQKMEYVPRMLHLLSFIPGIFFNPHTPSWFFIKSVTMRDPMKVHLVYTQSGVHHSAYFSVLDLIFIDPTLGFLPVLVLDDDRVPIPRPIVHCVDTICSLMICTTQKLVDGSYYQPIPLAVVKKIIHLLKLHAVIVP